MTYTEQIQTFDRNLLEGTIDMVNLIVAGLRSTGMDWGSEWQDRHDMSLAMLGSDQVDDWYEEVDAWKGWAEARGFTITMDGDTGVFTVTDEPQYSAVEVIVEWNRRDGHHFPSDRDQAIFQLGIEAALHVFPIDGRLGDEDRSWDEWAEDANF